MNRTYSGNKGFVMAGVLALLVIAPISMVTYMSMFRSSIKGERTIAGQFEYKNLNRSLFQLLSNERNCPNSLAGSDGQPASFPSTQPLEIQIGGERIAYVGKKIGSAVLTQLYLKRLSGPITVDDELEYVVTLNVEAQMPPDTYGTSKLSNKENPLLLNMRTNMAGTITKCSGTGTTESKGPKTYAEAFLVSNSHISYGSQRTPELVVKKGSADDFEMVTLRVRAGEHYTFYSGLQIHPNEHNIKFFGLRCKTENGWKLSLCTEATHGTEGWTGDLWALEGGCISNDWGHPDTTGMELRVICER